MSDTGNAAAQLNLNPLRQGSTFRRRFTIANDDGSPVDMSGWTFRGQIRRTWATPSPAAVVEFKIIDAPGGVAEFVIDAEATAKLTHGVHVWDAEYVDSGGDVHGLFQGFVLVTREVCR